MANTGNKIIQFWKIYSQRKTAVVGLIIVFVFVLAVALAPYISPYSPTLKTGAKFSAPSLAHPLGTNDIGVDILSELIYAGRVSLMVGIIAATLVVATGSIVGLVSGFFGGVVDEVLMRITDTVITLPRLPLMIVMAAYMKPGVWTIIFVYAVVGWASLARQVRSQVLSVRESTFIEASRAIGTSNTRIITGHILPNVIGIIIANGVMEIMYAILTEAGLSFLGFGNPTTPSWGTMLHFAQIQGAFLLGAWWWIIPPGLCIALICCGFQFIGTAFNDLFALKLGKR
jgi:peptide/nickel transport system permease protein